MAAGPAPQDGLLALAMVEREVDRARRTFGMFFEVFAQRGTAFAPALAAHDAIARDCYDAVRADAPRLFPGPLLAPLTYLEHGYSPATMRRGVTLSRLLGETNPFPLIRIPWDRDRPWQAVFLHEVSHNLQADMGLWVENRSAVIQRLAGDGLPPLAISIFGRWHKEIFADLCACLLGGPAVAWGMAMFLAHPADKVMTYRPGGPHPTGYLRVLILAEMVRRMGFGDEARQLVDGLARALRPEARPPHAAGAAGGCPARDPRDRRRDRLPAAPQPGRAGAGRRHPLHRRRPGGDPARRRCCSPAAAGRPSCRRASWSAPAATRSRPAPTSRPCRG